MKHQLDVSIVEVTIDPVGSIGLCISPRLRQ